MMKIDCSVTKCSHNKESVCYANRINVGGYGAKTACDTCCASFLDKAHYSNLTNNTNTDGPCDCLVCDAKDCKHNDNKLCTANSIQVNGGDVHIYNETECSTFALK
ncbi:DUF1540 domain-containing protein [Romboutsia weinsteinii]|uniref:DUF1540 domain-containing protein n=2 Tax=Romboutsia weinsteinii TaxID=2020949 RepID=A0A371J5Q5_9FIRM|nr:DUF1540 domain-containing protein [Romboutsia weinsteinii]